MASIDETGTFEMNSELAALRLHCGHGNAPRPISPRSDRAGRRPHGGLEVAGRRKAGQGQGQRSSSRLRWMLRST